MAITISLNPGPDAVVGGHSGDGELLEHGVAEDVVLQVVRWMVVQSVSARLRELNSPKTKLHALQI